MSNSNDIQTHLDHVAALYSDAHIVTLSEDEGLVIVDEPGGNLYVVRVTSDGNTDNATIRIRDWETGYDA